MVLSLLWSLSLLASFMMLFKPQIVRNILAKTIWILVFFTFLPLYLLISTSVVPRVWKATHVVQLHKGGNSSDLKGENDIVNACMTLLIIPCFYIFLNHIGFCSCSRGSRRSDRQQSLNFRSTCSEVLPITKGVPLFLKSIYINNILISY